MLSRFHLVPKCNGQTDGRTDKQTDRFAISISRVSMLTRDNKTILKPRLALPAWRLVTTRSTGVTARSTGVTARSIGVLPIGFSGHKIPHSSAYTISEKAIRFWHLDYDPDQANKLISSSMSRHLSTSNISSKSMHAFLSNLANRQTDRQTNTGKNIYLLLCRR